MKSYHAPFLRRLRATLRTTLCALVPVAGFADPVVFNADFSGAANTTSVSPSVISPTGATWYGGYNKANGALAAGANGIILSSTTGSSSAVIEFMGRVTQAPISLAADGDYIELSGTFYTIGLSNIAMGLFNSGGVDPLVTRADGVALLNNGFTSVTGQVAAGGTVGWTGYRAMSLGGSVNGDFKARAAQTGSPGYNCYELLSVGTGAYNSPSAINVGTVVNSATSVTWTAASGSDAFDFVYRITRNNATTFAFTYTIKTAGTSTVLYSASGSTTGVTAQPGAITSSFDAIAIGGRVNGTPNLQVAALKVTARNSDIARITDQPTAQSFPQGGPGSLSVVAAGSGALSYQWFKDGSPVSGATSATYSVSSASSSDIGDYYVIVTNAYGSETSSTVVVNVSSLSAPAITTQPTAQNVDAGTTLTLAALASGVPTPSYQWYRNDAPISGATSATYTVENAIADDAGNYKVVATNSQGSDTSDTVAVTINTAAPAITGHPSPTTVNVGQAINLSATASGLPAPSYQWYRNDVAIPGATASTYQVASATTADAGTYTVIATNTYGSAPSDGAPVTVNVVLPSITTQPPAALTVHADNRVTLAASYAGSAPLTYQWYKDDAPISGAIGSTYTIAAATSADAGTYHVVVTNEGGSAPSNDSVVSVVLANENPVFSTTFANNTLNNSAAVITSDVTSWFIMSGRAATNSSVGDDPLTTETVEARPLTLTWNTPAGSAIVETAARFSDTPVALGAVGDYLRLRATLRGTNLRTLCFGLYDSHGVSPVALDSSVNGETMSTSGAVGGGTQNWTGYRSSFTIGNTGGDIGTRPAQTATSTNRGQELLFPAGSTGAAFGEPAGVSAGVVPSLGVAFGYTDNTTYTLDYVVSLSATNQYTISYALYSGASATGTPLFTTNATTTTAAALPSAVAAGFDALAIGIRNDSSTTVPTLVISDLSVVKGGAVVGVAPTITTQPGGAQTLTPGQTLTLTAAASGTPTPTLQWYKNDAPISGATSGTYSIESVVTSDSGAYKLVATNSLGSDTSDVVSVTVGSASAYQSWASAQGLSSGVNDGATQDPDGDGVSNLLEFALGGNPLAANSAILPVVARSGANLTLTFDIKTAAKTDYTIGAESTTDLATSWSAVTHGVGGATVVETTVDGSTDRIVVTVPAPAAGAKTFLRVKVAPKS
jgi:hypothetical protein